jgi:demethylmenaquinone methyltransferase/2-methoxy-6-polyprenyl-1,4-benzoquinol methylase
MRAGERELLDDQIAYYRRRAAEYDETAYGVVDAALRRRIDAVVATLAPAGRGAEIACGTGVWTQALAPALTSLDALDASPEAIEIARERTSPSPVHFHVGDIFGWEPPDGRRYDCAFMAFWLSHVPAERWPEFLSTVGGWLAHDGRILIVDEHVDRRGLEQFEPDADGVATRTLRDGSRHRLVKVHLDPSTLVGCLADIGWRATVVEHGDGWVSAVAQRAGAPSA